MTSTIYGIGTRIYGSRHLTRQEYVEHVEDLEHGYDEVLHKIGTIGFCFLYIPIFPIETIIYADIKKINNEEVLEPCFIDKRDCYLDTESYVVFSTYNVNWKHVKSSVEFYLFPLVIIMLFIYNLLC